MTGFVTPARRASSSIDALAKRRSAKSCSPNSTSCRSAQRARHATVPEALYLCDGFHLHSE